MWEKGLVVLASLGLFAGAGVAKNAREVVTEVARTLAPIHGGYVASMVRPK